MKLVLNGAQLDLNARDIGTLQRAAYLHSRFDAGIGPRVGGQFAHYRRMERLGLLTFDGWGRDIDGEVERDVLVYQLTELGRLALAAIGTRS
jgi:hypothetical protein